MRMLRFLCAPATVLVFALPLVVGTAHAESNKVTVGKVIGGNGFHIPSYVAMDQGFYKAEGLDASFVIAARPAAGHGSAVRQCRFRADPVGRRAGGAERRRHHATSSASR